MLHLERRIGDLVYEEGDGRRAAASGGCLLSSVLWTVVGVVGGGWMNESEKQNLYGLKVEERERFVWWWRHVEKGENSRRWPFQWWVVENEYKLTLTWFLEWKGMRVDNCMRMGEWPGTMVVGWSLRKEGSYIWSIGIKGDIGGIDATEANILVMVWSLRRRQGRGS